MPAGRPAVPLPKAATFANPAAAMPGGGPEKLAEMLPGTPAVHRVRVRKDFLAANAGVRVPMPAFILLVHPTAKGQARAGFTVTKRIGNAVARNRAKRRLREAARLAMPDHAHPSADHIFIARGLPTERPFPELLADTRRALDKARRRLEPPA